MRKLSGSGYSGRGRLSTRSLRGFEVRGACALGHALLASRAPERANSGSEALRRLTRRSGRTLAALKRHRWRSAEARKGRALLGRRNLTITEGAQKLGVSRSYFSQLLAGRRALSPKVRRRLLTNAPFCELSPDDLWRETPEEPEVEVARGA